MITDNLDSPNLKRDYYTIEELARKLGKSTQTIRRWEAKGQIKSYQLRTNSRKYYLKSEFSNLLRPSQTI